MAVPHYSGFDGSIAFAGGSSTTPGWNTEVVEWSLEYGHQVYRTPRFGNSNTPRIVGIADFRILVQFLLDTAIGATDLAVGNAVTVRLGTDSTPADYFEGTAVVERMAPIRSPIDGPVMGTAVLLANNSGLTWTQA